MSMLTLFESRYTLKGRYNIGNVDKTASMSMLTLFESEIIVLCCYSQANSKNGADPGIRPVPFFGSNYP